MDTLTTLCAPLNYVVISSMKNTPKMKRNEWIKKENYKPKARTLNTENWNKTNTQIQSLVLNSSTSFCHWFITGLLLLFFKCELYFGMPIFHVCVSLYMYGCSIITESNKRKKIDQTMRVVKYSLLCCFFGIGFFFFLVCFHIQLTSGRPQYHDLTRCVKPPKWERIPSR